MFELNQKWRITKAGCSEEGWPWTKENDIYEVKEVGRLALLQNSEGTTIRANYDSDIVEYGFVELVEK